MQHTASVNAEQLESSTHYINHEETCLVVQEKPTWFWCMCCDALCGVGYWGISPPSLQPHTCVYMFDQVPRQHWDFWKMVICVWVCWFKACVNPGPSALIWHCPGPAKVVANSLRWLHTRLRWLEPVILSKACSWWESVRKESHKVTCMYLLPGHPSRVLICSERLSNDEFGANKMKEVTKLPVLWPSFILILIPHSPMITAACKHHWFSWLSWRSNERFSMEKELNTFWEAAGFYYFKMVKEEPWASVWIVYMGI